MSFKSVFESVKRWGLTRRGPGEFQTDGPEIENDRSTDLLDLGTTGLLWLLVAERRLDRRSDSRSLLQQFKI